MDEWINGYYACNANANRRESAPTHAYTLAGTVNTNIKQCSKYYDDFDIISINIDVRYSHKRNTGSNESLKFLTDKEKVYMDVPGSVYITLHAIATAAAKKILPSPLL